MNNIVYINIIVSNSIWVLNRITNLIRKRNYNIDDMNLTFDRDWNANILIWFFNDKININQIVEQLKKLYDIDNIEIINDIKRIKKTIYVYSLDESWFDQLSIKPDKTVLIPNSHVWIYILDYNIWIDFIKELNQTNLKYLIKSI